MELAEQVRREFGAQLPAAPVRESHADRDRRQEQTKFELETKVLPIVNEQRVASREPALSEAEEDIVVELILSAMFLLPRLYGILAGEPLAEDVLVFPGQPVRVDRADGTKSYYPALARTAEELTQMIADVAATHHRPFSFEHPFVDVQLSPRLRFHGQGFDVVSRPAIFIRVHRVMGATFDDLFEWGSISNGMRYLLGTAAVEAQLSAATTGVQGSGKTTVLRVPAGVPAGHADRHRRDRFRVGVGVVGSAVDTGDAGADADDLDVAWDLVRRHDGPGAAHPRRAEHDRRGPQ